MSTDPSTPPYDLLYGPFYFGTILSTAFYGVACIQTFFYYVHYPKDRTRIKVFVGAIWAFNTIHEALAISGTYKYIMAGLLIPNSYKVGNPEMILQVVPTLLVTIHMRAFFVYRIYIVTGKKIVAPLIWVVLATLQLGKTLYYFWDIKPEGILQIQAIVLYYLSNALYSVNGQVQVVEFSKLASSPIINLITVLLSVGSGMDILIAIFMIFILWRKRTAGLGSTVHILQRLVVFAINTGVWPAIFSLLTVIFLHIFPTTTVYFIPRIPLCAVYCNSLLANLNARAYIGGGVTTYVVNTDLFANQASEVSTHTGMQGTTGEMLVFSPPQQGVWKTTEMSVFSDA